ncbi:DNA mismatch repair ATPase MutS [Chitinophaga terrae (ex Kim and Jung 2007)]|uniref:MutS-related protein n=1 Tax=Chitinophaga terrae (ex Kim and Jung 2007) TaxID=408074 RepID=UPI0027815498|nr:DNA mismatch repair protein [Chitinophaga terrae (ex Kim and Jung 2007)]MDQ0106757.1 DNA mismatch repair ATPase MutS [Chitinophaga terrae (ex Kim and Jung 2007)]
MSLMTDKQTLTDLNIFGKGNGDGIYAIYNSTFTRGGAELLEEMFRNPLSDVQAINARSRIIRSFAEKELSFPYDVAWFDGAEQYLENTDERSRLNDQQDTLGRKLNQLIAGDNAYKAIEKGVESLINILQTTTRFAADMRQQLAGIPDNRELTAIDQLLKMEDLQPMLTEAVKHKLPFAKVAEYDKILRFRHRDVMKRLLQDLYLADVYLSVAKVAVKRGFTFPLALEKELQTVVLEDFYHPSLTAPVVNSLNISLSNNVIFLTGANMAGKSTFMKALGIAMFLGQMGFPVPASRMEFSVRDGIFTTINLPDNLSMGASHFYAEVLRIKNIARELSRDKYLFVIFDELFRGTNVKDAYEATIAVTSAIARRKNCMFVVSTHIIEAGDVLKEKCSNINFVYLPTLMEGNKPVYTHKLTQGITADRHGMIIIKNEGILDILGRKKSIKKTT